MRHDVQLTVNVPIKWRFSTLPKRVISGQSNLSVTEKGFFWVDRLFMATVMIIGTPFLVPCRAFSSGESRFKAPGQPGHSSAGWGVVMKQSGTWWNQSSAQLCIFSIFEPFGNIFYYSQRWDVIPKLVVEASRSWPLGECKPSIYPIVI